MMHPNFIEIDDKFSDTESADREMMLWEEFQHGIEACRAGLPWVDISVAYSNGYSQQYAIEQQQSQGGFN